MTKIMTMALLTCTQVSAGREIKGIKLDGIKMPRM